jgi:hypothetical protein
LKIAGVKSRFWEKMVYYSPPFSGSEVEARRNVASHTWRTVHLHQRYSEASENWDPVDECHKCGVLSKSERSRYACGKAPPAEKFTE